MKKWGEVAKENKIPVERFRQRVVKLGWEKKKAATTPVRKVRCHAKWTKLAESNGINYVNYMERVNRLGWSKEKSSTTPIRRRDDIEWSRIAQINGVAYDTYLNRVHNLFWAPEEAAITPAATAEEVLKYMREQKKELVEVRHELINNDPANLFAITPQHIEEAKKNGIGKNTFLGRIYNNGWTVSDAISTPVQSGFLKPDKYDEYLKIAIENNVSQPNFRYRVEAGWSLQDASSKPLMKRTTRRRKDAEWIEKALENGINYRTYLTRVREMQWPKEKAATIPALPSGQFLNEERRKAAIEGSKNFKERLMEGY